MACLISWGAKKFKDKPFKTTNQGMGDFSVVTVGDFLVVISMSQFFSALYITCLQPPLPVGPVHGMRAAEDLYPLETRLRTEPLFE